MTPKTYLEPETSYCTTSLPQTVADRAAEFEATREKTEIMTVHHIERNQWQFVYAINRGTKRHTEHLYKFTVTP